jgi:hypothetical protein
MPIKTFIDVKRHKSAVYNIKKYPIHYQLYTDRERLEPSSLIRNRVLFCSPFGVPVAIRMHFHVGLELTPPQIHWLPKHYLDLLQTPIASRPRDCRPLLLQDGRLVQALFCSFSFAHKEPSAPFMTFEVTTHLLQHCDEVLPSVQPSVICNSHAVDWSRFPYFVNNSLRAFARYES